jgi:hypothetical protein
MKTLLFATVIAAMVTQAHADPAGVYHYACKRGDDRYALTVRESIIKLQEHGPPFTLTTFRILKSIPVECGKGGWRLSDGATFCYATQGVGTLTWHGHEFDCDQADTE